MSKRTRWENSTSRKHSNSEDAEDKQVHYRARNAVFGETAGCVPAVDKLRADGVRTRESVRWGKRRGCSGSNGAARGRSSNHDVSSPGMGPAVAIRTGQFHFTVAPGFSLSVPREKQPYAGSAGRHLARVDALHRVARDEHDRIPVRRAGDGWARA